MKKLILLFGLLVTSLLFSKNGLAQSMALIFNITSPNTTINLPLDGSYNVNIDWSDGTPIQNIVSPNNASHTYTKSGTFSVVISGNLHGFGKGYFRWNGVDYLLAITSFENLGLKSLNGALADADLLVSLPPKLPNSIDTLSYCFALISQSSLSYLNQWDVSNVKDMSFMFYYAKSFNQNIGSWNVSNVTNMKGMFSNATAFDQNIGSWNVSNVKDMSNMFSGVTLSTKNYSALLYGWSGKSVQHGVTFDAGNSKYYSGGDADSCKKVLINTYGWTITDGGTVSGFMRIINAGNLQQHSFTTEGVTVQFTSGNTDDIQLVIERITQPPSIVGSLPSSITRIASEYWTATVDSGTVNGTYNITLDLSNIYNTYGFRDCSKLKVLKRPDNNSSWVDVESLTGVSLDKSSCPSSLKVIGLTSFSDFVIASTWEEPLPVELNNFSGKSITSGIQLNWATQTETDNAGFVLFRNGVEIANYNTTEALQGNGTTSQSKTYSYTDSEVNLNDTYVYEIVSVDFSGERHTYDKIVEVMYTKLHDNQKVEEYALNQNYPNPFNPSTTITYTMKKAGVATLKVYDMLGRLVIEQTKTSVKGENQINFNGSKLTSGMYYYQLSAEGFSKTLKMMLVK